MYLGNKNSRMKLLLIFSLSLICCLFGQAQVVAKNNGSRQFIYSGMTNEIKLAVAGKRDDAISVSVTNGTIEGRKRNGIYDWKLCDSINRIEYLRVYYKKILIDSLPFYVVNQGNNIIILGSKWLRNDKSINYDLNNFKTCKKLIECINGDSLDPLCSVIIRFKIKIIKLNGDILTFTNLGIFFSNELQQEFHELTTSEKVVFYDFEVKNGCENISKIYPAEYVVIMTE